MSVERLVIDSSVAIKWRLRDEGELAQADALQDDFVAGRVELLVPMLFDYEVGNVLKVAVTRARLTEAEAVVALADFKVIKIERHQFLPYQGRAFQLAIQYQRSVYDAAYLALAEAHGLDLLYGRQALIQRRQRQFPMGKVDWRLPDLIVSNSTQDSNQNAKNFFTPSYSLPYFSFHLYSFSQRPGFLAGQHAR